MHRHRRETGEPAKYYRPLVVLSFWLDRRAWGTNPAGFHLTNVLLNLLAGLLVTLLLWQTFRDRSPPARFWFTLLGGLAFAVHPMHVESVAFISGRTDILAAVFILPALLGLSRFREEERARWAVLAVVGFALSLLCKETAILFPLLALLVLVRTDRAPGSPRRWALASCLSAVAVLYLVLRTTVIRSAAPSFADMTPGRHALLILNTVGRYVSLAVFPFFRRTLYADSGTFTVPGWLTVVGAMSLSGLALLAWRFRRTALGLGCACFLVFILPVANFLPVGASVLAERLLYLPVFGAVLTLAGTATYIRSTRLRNVLVTAAVAFIGLMTWNTLARMPAWRNAVELYGEMVSENPASAEARGNLGIALRQRGDLAGAERELAEAVRLNPGVAVARLNLADVLRTRGDLGSSRHEYEAALEMNPELAEAHLGLGIVLGRTGKQDSAVARFRQAIRLRPDLAEAHANLGTALAMTNMPDSAKHHFWTAIRLRPDLDQAYANLEKLYRWLGREDSASIVRGLRPSSDRRK